MRKRWEHLRSSWKPSWPTSPTPVRQRSAMLPLLKRSIGRACWTSATTSWTASVAPVDTQHYLYRDIHFYGKLWNNDYFGQDSFVVVCVCVMFLLCGGCYWVCFVLGGGVWHRGFLLFVCVTVPSCVQLLFFSKGCGGLLFVCVCGLWFFDFVCVCSFQMVTVKESYLMSPHGSVYYSVSLLYTVPFSSYIYIYTCSWVLWTHKFFFLL